MLLTASILSLLMSFLLYLGIGCGEWFLALKRTRAALNKQWLILIILVFIENMAAFWVSLNFINEQDWMISTSYSIGAALGSLFGIFGKPIQMKDPDIEILYNEIQHMKTEINLLKNH